MKVYSRADTHWVTLILWMDDERQNSGQNAYYWYILILSKFKLVSFIHQNWDFLIPPSDGVFVTQTSYGDLLDRMKLPVKDILGLSGSSAKVVLCLL